MPTLPPLGSLDLTVPGAGDGVCSIIDGWVQESATRRGPLEPAADRNLNLYIGYHWTTAAPEFVERLVINRIVNAIISQVQVQFESTPNVKFTPRESLETPDYYLNTKLDTPPTPQVLQLLAMLPPETYQPWTGPDGSSQLPRALTDQEVQLVEQAINVATQQAAMIPGSDSAIPADILIGVTDRIATEALQTLFDAKWDECDADFTVGENGLYNAIIGWQFMLYEWDDERCAHILKNVPFLQIHIDPLATNLRDAQFLVYDQVMSADEAVAIYPDLVGPIREHASPGVIQPAGYQYRQSSVYSTNFQRDMITVRTAWVRNQPVPLTPEDALKQQMVTQEIETTEIPTLCDCGAGLETPIGQHTPGCPARGDYEGPSTDTLVAPDASAPSSPETLDPSDLVDVTPPAQDPGAMLPPASSTATMTTYRTPAGAAVTPDHPLWPSRPVIRQLRIIANTLVDDRECEYTDIPAVLNVNIPIPFSPYGQGEPERLQGLQHAINSVASDMVTHFHFHAQPAECVPESVNERLPNITAKMYTAAPGTKFVVPDELWTMLSGKLGFFQDPPKMPSDAWQLLELLLKLMDDESNNSEVMQGKASASWSGEAIQALQRAAKGSIGWKSRRTEFMLKQLARTMAGSIIHRMPLKEKIRYVSKYPEQVWYAIDQRHKQIDVDIAVEVASGGGQRQQIEKVSILSGYDRGLISPQTAIEAMGRDPKIELHNQIQWAQEKATAQAQVPQVAAMQPAPGQVPPQPPEQQQPAPVQPAAA